MALWIDVGPSDLLCVGGDTYLSVERKSGTRVRLKIIGKGEVELMRNSKMRLVPSEPPLNPPRASTGD